MSDSEDSTVTYTTVSSPFEGLSYTGSPGVDGPPVMPEDPYAYVVASFQAPPSSTKALLIQWQHVTLTEAKMAKTTMILALTRARFGDKLSFLLMDKLPLVGNQIKFPTCTILGSALTWWNSHVKTVGHDVDYAMNWINLKKKMTDKYCPRGEELALMYARMFPEESDIIKKYVGGLLDMIHRSVMASKPKTMQDAIEFATELMDKKIHTLAER
ncbi:hypothetical protein Tco_1393089 [Tanacetum coccineum]